MTLKNRLNLGRFVVLLTICMPLLGWAGEHAIVIGHAIDLSGPNGSIGRDYVAGIKTYFDFLNSNGGIRGKRIDYIVRDDHGEPQKAAKEVSELIQHDHAEFVLGAIGDAANDAIVNAPAFVRSDLMLFAPLASGINKNMRVVFWRPNYQHEIQYLLSYFDKLGIKNVGILYQESSLNREAYERVLLDIRTRGMKVTEEVRINSSGTALDSETKRLAASRPGFVLTIADTITTSLFLKKFRTYDAHTIVAGTSLINLSALREIAGPRAVEWTVFSQVVPNPNGQQSGLQMEHMRTMKKYRDEEVSALTLEGFAVAKTLAMAMQQSTQHAGFLLQELIAQKRMFDLGGFSIGRNKANDSLSNYLDVALFKNGSALVF